jgi:hypothetical protein
MHLPYATDFQEKFEIMNFDIFCKTILFQIKMAITFAYRLKKILNMWKTTYAKSYIRFQWPYAVCINSCFSKFQREIRKQEDFKFCQKNKKIDFFEFLISFNV